MQGKQRPDLVDVRPKHLLFSTAGQTGWHRRRNLGNYKEGKSEKTFAHLDSKWADPEDAA
jgi:hypothetical protein